MQYRLSGQKGAAERLLAFGAGFRSGIGKLDCAAWSQVSLTTMVDHNEAIG